MNIKEGDRVKHKRKLINGGLDMHVIKIEGDQTLCIHLDPKDKNFKEEWLDLRI
jgi:hypothetical protein